MLSYSSISYASFNFFWYLLAGALMCGGKCKVYHKTLEKNEESIERENNYSFSAWYPLKGHKYLYNPAVLTQIKSVWLEKSLFYLIFFGTFLC